MVDGDTVEVSPAVGGNDDVRLIGVDTPETVDPNEDVQPYGPQASRITTRERERAERSRAMYTNLGLRIVAHKDGALELTWRAGEGVSQVCASPRCTGPATIS